MKFALLTRTDTQSERHKLYFELVEFSYDLQFLRFRGSYWLFEKKHFDLKKKNNKATQRIVSNPLGCKFYSYFLRLES